MRNNYEVTATNITDRNHCLDVGLQFTKPMPAVDYVDLERFMGDWYVIANIPTF